MLRHLLALLTLLAAPFVVQAQEDVDAEVLPVETAVLDVAGRDPAPLPTTPGAGGPLFAVEPVVEALGGGLVVGPGYQLTLPETRVVFGPGSEAITIDREIVQLSEAPRQVGERLFVPLDLLRHTYGRVLGFAFTWEAEERRLRVAGSREALSVDWNVVQIEGMSTLVLRFPDPVRFDVEEDAGGLTVRLFGDRLAPPADSVTVADPLVRDIRFGDREVRIDLVPGTTAEHYTRSDPFRIVFDIFRRATADRAAEGADETPRQRVDVPVDTIVIDPGHGGEETGAVGPGGSREKELNLLLARTLARRLQQRLGVEVVLTRSEDEAVPLDSRSAIANQHQAELFVSLHLNSSPGGGGRGAETYFLSLEASDRRAAEAARHGNRGAEGDSLSDLQLILWDLAQSEHLAESQRLAKLVQAELNETLGLEDRGVKQAPFRVLMGATMPAVLVELGFLSNPEEEERLRRPSYRAELVEALVRAVSRFLAPGEGRSSDDSGEAPES